MKINEITKKLNISLRTLERKFYKLYKMSPIKFYVNLRIKFARNLLFYDDRKINEISSIAGFNYNSVFINSFKKIYKHFGIIQNHTNHLKNYQKPIRKCSNFSIHTPTSLKNDSK